MKRGSSSPPPMYMVKVIRHYLYVGLLRFLCQRLYIPTSICKCRTQSVGRRESRGFIGFPVSTFPHNLLCGILSRLEIARIGLERSTISTHSYISTTIPYCRTYLDSGAGGPASLYSSPALTSIILNTGAHCIVIVEAIL